jgi:hypothetical protein
MLDRAEAAQVFQIIDIDMPVIDLIAAPAQQIADHVLARPLGAAGRRYRDEIPRGGKLRVETGIDGIEDSLLGIAGVHCVFVPLGGGIEKARARGSNHTLADGCSRF